MSVAEQTPVAGYTGNGVTTAFSFPFTVLAEGDLGVLVDGALQTLNVAYTVTGVGGSSGTVTFTTAPANTAVIVIYRDSDLTRATDYQDNGDLLAATLNRDLDRLWLALQEMLLGAKLSPRAVRAPVGETLDDLPSAADRADSFLRFDTDGQPTAYAGSFDSSTALALDIASTATGKGAALVGYLSAGTGAVGRTVQAKLREWVNVEDFGAVGDGANDDTAAIQAAITYCLATKTTVTGALGGGCVNLYFPPGLYKVTATLNIQTFTGFRMFGAGPQSTQICFTGSSSVLFNVSGYVGFDVEDMTLVTGTISFTSGVPTVADPGTASRNNVCFTFNGTGGGTLMRQSRVWAYYWNKVYTTLVGAVNCDDHKHDHCAYFANNFIWDNSNTQALLWHFYSCKFFSTATTLFKNPATNFMIVGGDFINPGVFLEASLASCGSDSVFIGLRFENYQNIDASSAPQFLNISGTCYLTFIDCIARGGGTLVGKTSATLAGIYSIKVIRCYFTGTWAATVASSSGGITSRLVFEDCESGGVPTVTQTLVGGQGNRPLNIEYRRHRATATAIIDRMYQGVLSSQAQPTSNPPVYESVRLEATLTAATATKSVPIIVHSPYTLLVTGVRVSWTNNTAVTCTITVWQDSTKAVQLCTFTTAASSGNQQYFEARTGSGLTAIAQLTSASNPLYFEVTTAGAAGATRTVLTVELTQSTI